MFVLEVSGGVQRKDQPSKRYVAPVIIEVVNCVCMIFMFFVITYDLDELKEKIVRTVAIWVLRLCKTAWCLGGSRDGAKPLHSIHWGYRHRSDSFSDGNLGFPSPNL